MKIKLKNLGALQEAEFELADLTIICGGNNTGKTYATYALYGFLKQWRELTHKIYSFPRPSRISRSVKFVAETVLKEGVVILDIMERIDPAKNALDIVCEMYSHELPRIFSSQSKRFESTSFAIKIDDDKDLKNRLLEVKFADTYGSYLEIEKKENDKYIKIVMPEYRSESDASDRIKKLPFDIAKLTTWIIFYVLFPNVFISSTERTGAAIFEKELNFARNRLLAEMSNADEKTDLRKLLSRGYQDYALPVMDNVEFVRKLSSISKESSFLVEQHPEVLNDFADIIGGDYYVHKQNGLQYKPKGKALKLSMDESSSAVRSLLDIGFYLRHKAEVGDLLMIDEPELSLHPENQRRIARLLVRLVNLGLKIFVTTHSDYIVKEFNTLIMLNRDMPHLIRIAEEEKYHSDELLTIDKVELYIAQEDLIKREKMKRKSKCQTLVRANISQAEGIEVRSFDQTINKMNEIQDSIMWGYNQGHDNE